MIKQANSHYLRNIDISQLGSHGWKVNEGNNQILLSTDEVRILKRLEDKIHSLEFLQGNNSDFSEDRWFTYGDLIYKGMIEMNQGLYSLSNLAKIAKYEPAPPILD